VVSIDGSHGEGGGQVLRTALALSVLTGEATRIERIRHGRREPGLRPQHLMAVRAAAAVCGARIEGDELGSQELTFVPGGPARAGNYTFDVARCAQRGSAGSVGLILQTVLLPLARADGISELTLRGGTHVPWAPSAFYLAHVFLPVLGRMGPDVSLNVRRWGFYPAGGGELQVRIVGNPRALHAIDLSERGGLRRVWGDAVAQNLPAHIAQRMADRVHNVLVEFAIKAQVTARRLHGAGPGAGVFLVADYEHVPAGFTAYGRRGVPSEHVAESACEELLAHDRSGLAVDPYLADQMALPMALATGESRLETSRVTQHLLTVAWVVRQFLPREIVIEGQPGKPGKLVVRRNVV